MTQILLAGCGNMGGAMLDGWRRLGGAAIHFTVVDPTLTPKQEANITMLPALDATVPVPDMVVLAVKPQMLEEALPPLVAVARPDTVWLSIVAGVSIAWFEEHIGEGRRSPPSRPPGGDAPAVIRTMPNTPAAIGQGVIAMLANDSVAATMQALAEKMLGVLGTVVRLNDEADMDAVTAISGSGPAYIFLMREALEAAAVALGLTPEVAATLAGETILGSALMMRDSPLTPSQLRANVTSPKGTTEAALNILMADDALANLLKKATTAARNRSQAMGL